MDMNAPVGRTPLDDRPNSLVGRPVDRVDGPLKVTGRATYAYEYAGQGAAAYGYIVQSSIPKGRIAGIDVSLAERAPGVLLVMTYKTAPRLAPKSDTSVPELQDDTINYYGQAVAFVVAETFEVARSAAHLVKVDYRREPGAFELKPMMASARIPKSEHGPPDTRVGNFESAFAAAPIRVDSTYSTPHQIHAMMEPHATIAEWQDDQLILHTSNQMLNEGQDSIGATFKMPPDKVRLISRYIGGGFGNKLQVYPDAILSAMAARQLNRRVKVALTRQQLFHLTSHRSETVQRVRLGADATGKILAIGHEAWSANLPDADFYETAANQTRTLYAGANRMTAHRLASLNLPKAASMRAPGEAVGLLALEGAMDELAERLNMDPIALRIANEPSEDPEKHIPFSSRHLVSCLKEGAKRFDWSRRQSTPGTVREGRWLIGMGVASATRNNPLKLSQAKVRLGPDGALEARMAMTDIGTGSYTVLTQIAAELLGLPMDKVSVLLGDTTFPKASGSGGSFGANSAGSALYEACMNLRAKLSLSVGVDPSQATFQNAMMTCEGRSHRLADLVGATGLEADGEIRPGDMRKAYSQQSYGAHFAEVAVDADTGEVRLRRMLGVFTAGRILNEKTARSQLIGGMTFGVGAGLMEEAVVDPRFGFFVNHDLAEYLVPVDADIVDLDAVILPELDPMSTPLKTKGLGELGICGAGAAIANAIYNACGARIRDYPLTLDKVMAAMPRTMA
jgi:xanthine dehydrogenase YagR molybdenum-binding subunit